MVNRKRCHRLFTFCLALLFLLLIACRQNSEPADREENAVPALPEISDDRISAALQTYSDEGCVVEICNTAKREPLVLLNEVNLERRTEKGWEACVVLRADYEGNTRTVAAGSSTAFSYDWTFAYGRLVPGEYRACWEGFLQGRKGAQTGCTIRIPFRITETECMAAQAVLPGETEAAAPEGIKVDWETCSAHKWMLTLKTDAIPYWVEQGYALYRLEGGEYRRLQPIYNLLGSFRPLRLNTVLTEKISPAAQYESLPAGDYLLQQRLTVQKDAALPEYWDGVDADSLQMITVKFRIDEPLEALPQPADPEDILWYTGEDSVDVRLAITLKQEENGVFSFELCNLGEETLHISNQPTLYFSAGSEWFPVFLQRRIGVGLPEFLLEGGESRMIKVSMTRSYGELAEGTYRLVWTAENPTQFVSFAFER